MIDAWLRTDDAGRLKIVWIYFQKNNENHKWKQVQVFDISKEKDREKFQSYGSDYIYSDPMYVLKGEKL